MATIAFTSTELAALAGQVAALIGAPPVVTPPVITPPAPGTFWVYQAGKFNWESDYSWNANINYFNTVGKAGGTCISVTITAPNGGFQPFAQGKKFDVSPYKYLTYSVKPTLANAIFATGFAAINDVPDGPQGGVVVVSPGLTKYGPAPQIGVWGTYKVPLADFGLTNLLVQKFTIADGTGVGSNLYYVDNIGFTP